ncbi:MAG: M48 family metalloprotease [Cytophagaceae bacterium]|jgi:Zn-dependent protease with chaperone function|nr:M48 family metalloprotease [Cytophagaceae bacterium]
MCIVRSLLLLVSFALFSQEFRYADSIRTKSKLKQLEIKSEVLKRLGILKNEKKDPFIDYLNQTRKTQREILLAYLDSGLVTSDQEIYDYINTPFSHLLEANNLKRENYLLILVKDAVPNAYNFGEGIIVVNLGLIPHFSNIYQLTMVLAHELAHDTEKHVYNSCKKHFEEINSEKMKAELEKIKNSEYNSYQKLKKLLTNYGININQHSRSHEFEADSIGYRFYENAGYFRSQAVATLKALDGVDSSFYKAPLDFKSLLNGEKFPYKRAWEYYEEPIFSEQNEDDSLGTHPNCQKRAAKIQQLIPTDNKEVEFTDAQYAKMVRRCEWLLLEASLRMKDYGDAFYRCCELLKREPKNSMLYEIACVLLKSIYNYQVDHDLDKIVSMPSTLNRDNYNQCLTILHNLSLQEILKIGFNLSNFSNTKTQYSSLNMWNLEYYFSQQLNLKEECSRLNNICHTSYPDKSPCIAPVVITLTFK